MAWTDYSSTNSDLWSADIGVATSSQAFIVYDLQDFFMPVAESNSALYPYVTGINSVTNSYNIPGFEDGYQPAGTANPIAGDMGGGSGGGSARPSSGFIYPRGDS